MIGSFRIRVEFKIMFQKFTFRRLFALAVTLSLALVVQGVASAQDDASLQFVSWQEPQDAAYTVDVPDGWVVDGATVDVFGTLEPSLYLFSPGNTAVVILTAPEATIYAEPTGKGYTEGESIAVSETISAIVRRYEDPLIYLEDYLRGTLLIDACAILTVTDAQGYEQTDPTVAEGDLTVSCQYPDGSATGYFYGSIFTATADDGSLLWMPGDIYGYLAEPGYEAQAEEALVRAVQSYTPTTQMVAADNTYVDNSGTDSTDTDAYLQAQQDMYQSQQTYAMMSNMLAMQHETNMAIISNIGGGGYTYEYEWVYDN
jgi:hypothetical protein